MSERRARAILTAYRLMGSAAFPLVGGYVAWRASKGKEERGRRRERYGVASRPRPDGPLIWMHAASVGETLAVAPLIDRLLDYGVHVVLTTGTVTSARLVGARLGDRVIHQYVPLDLRPAVRRFLDYWRPDLAIIAESEIWPVTILELGRAACRKCWSMGGCQIVHSRHGTSAPTLQKPCSKIWRMWWRSRRPTQSDFVRWARGR
jgi:3-deoxy-D-manno-octulosonic-acid transferase